MPSPARGQGRRRPGTAGRAGCKLARRASCNDLCDHSPAEGGRSGSGGRRAAQDPHPGAQASSHPLSRAGGVLLPSLRTCGWVAGSRAPALLPNPLPLLSSPLPFSVPPLGAGTHSAPMMSSGGNLPCSKAGIIQRCAARGGGGSRAFRRTQKPRSRPGQTRGVRTAGSESVCAGRAGWAWWGQSPGRQARSVAAAAAAKILNSVFTLTADAQGKRKVSWLLRSSWRPRTVMDTYVASQENDWNPRDSEAQPK